ncbi:hypothetical protein HD554DRAFT_2035457 [Boletus coccyginus]|nr:hypothetical protein HD554DRAFT_2035457 [Boletus coccyginus]
MAEQVVESAAPSPVQETADEPPTTESPSEEQDQVMVDEEEDEEDDIVEVMAPKPSRAPVHPNMIIYISPCDPCQRGGRTCTGVPGRTCDSCIWLKMKCGKSKGKGGKAKKDMVLVPGPKVKGKKKGHPRLDKNLASKLCAIMPAW